jgi:hypothetical protein
LKTHASMAAILASARLPVRCCNPALVLLCFVLGAGCSRVLIAEDAGSSSSSGNTGTGGGESTGGSGGGSGGYHLQDGGDLCVLGDYAPTNSCYICHRALPNGGTVYFLDNASTNCPTGEVCTGPQPIYWTEPPGPATCTPGCYTGFPEWGPGQGGATVSGINPSCADGGMFANTCTDGGFVPPGTMWNETWNAVGYPFYECCVVCDPTSGAMHPWYDPENRDPQTLPPLRGWYIDNTYGHTCTAPVLQGNGVVWVDTPYGCGCADPDGGAC